MRYDIAREILSEAIEQLDELNKATYRSYINKAAKDIKRRSVHGGFDASSIYHDGRFTTGDGDDDEKENRKVDRRIKGIGRAVKALGGNAKNAKRVAKNIKRRSVHGGFGAASVDPDGSFTTDKGDSENRRINRSIKRLSR